MNADLRLALEMADAADAITMHWFQSSSLAVRTKTDQTPVSAADEAVERTLRERLAAVRPGDAVVGEEYGSAGNSPRRWFLDPIDATKNYVRGILAFATLIALEENGAVTVAVVSAPALARRWWASKGEGAFCNGRQIRVSRIGAISDALVTYDSVADFDRHGGTDAFLALVRRCGRARGFGDFWAHMLVAEGAADIAIEPAVATWDVAPVQLIVEEAGGRFTDLRGNRRYDGGSALSTNGLLHDTVLELFR